MERDNKSKVNAATDEAAVQMQRLSQMQQKTGVMMNEGAAAFDTVSDFSFPAPTEHVLLPSKGKLYPEGHPLHMQETIEIRFMTAKEEDILISRTLMKKNLVFDKLLSSIIMDKRIDPRSLLIGDRNAIIIAARISAYGDDYSFSTPCRMCGEMSNLTYNLFNCLPQIEDPNGEDEEVFVAENQEKLENALSQLLEIIDKKGTFEVVLPKSKLTMRCKPMTGFDEHKVLETIQLRRKRKLDENFIQEQIRGFVVEVSNGHKTTDNPGQISTIISQLPSLDVHHLMDEYKRLVPDIDITLKFVCSECETENETMVPVHNVNKFFRSN
jgi:hypothetical protein